MPVPKTSALRDFAADARGGFATTFALVAPVLLVGISGAINYSYAVSLQQRTQAAADSAVLAATVAMADAIKTGKSMTPEQAQAVALRYFTTNAPDEALATKTSSVAPVTTVVDNVVTTTLGFQANPNTLINGLFPMPINVTAAATSTVALAKAGAVGSIAGNGWVSDDPYVAGANYQSFLYQCDHTHATWYNMLSDVNLQINTNCDGQNPDATGVYQMNIMVGSHLISTTPGLIPKYSGPFAGWNIMVWYGDVTVDGRFYPAPNAAGSRTLLDDPVNKLKVEVVIDYPGFWDWYKNYIKITTANYQIALSYDGDGYGLGHLIFATTSAGACGAPSGIFGQTLTGHGDPNADHFIVSGPTAKSPEFSKTCAAVAAANTKAKLSQ